MYLTDEGFGPLVRCAAVINELRALMPGLQVEVQTSNHVEFFPSLSQDVTLVKRHNLIRWHRHPDGQPDLPAIRAYYADYESESRQFVEEHLALGPAPDFVISDFVYEAFEVAHRQGVPCFGLAHFTWDWFFGKLYPNPIPPAVAERWRSQVDTATRLFFPMFTPDDIVAHHDNASEIPLIVRPTTPVRFPEVPADCFKILVVDSGSRVLQDDLTKALAGRRANARQRIFVRDGLQTVPAPDVMTIPPEQKMIDWIPHMDLVIGRAGFNTISECLAARVPMLLLGEAMNPEMAANIMAMKSRNLASFVDVKAISEDFSGTVDQFLAGEYPTIRRQVSNHTIGLNGAHVAAAQIAATVLGSRP